MASLENDQPILTAEREQPKFDALALLKEAPQKTHDNGMMSAVYHPDSDNQSHLQEAHWHGGGGYGRGYGGMNGWEGAALGLFLGSQLGYRQYYAPPPVYYAPPPIIYRPPVYADPDDGYYYGNPSVGQRYYQRPYYPQQYQYQNRGW